MKSKRLIKLTIAQIVLTIGFIQTVKSQTILDNYVETGLKNNLVIQQKNISIEKAMYALKTANSLFFPTINLKGDYQSGEGGRQIALPLGDMLNPVYSTLNQLTAKNSFPQINNVDVNFFPNDFFDAKIRTSLTIYNSDLIYNRKIQKQKVMVQNYEIETYKTELTKNIRVSYFNYLSALQIISVYENALSLAYEGKRNNESLLKNGKGLKAYLLRSESEIQDLNAKKIAAQNQAKNAKMYFNFLINVEPTEDIKIIDSINIDPTLLNKFISNDFNVSNRTEIRESEQFVSIFKNAESMNKAYWQPKIAGFLDLGTQSSNWTFNNKSRYYFVGLQVDIPLFSSGNNIYKIKQSKLDLQNQVLNTNHTRNQILLSAEVAKNNLISAYQNYEATIKLMESATAYYELIDKGYKEGINTFLEMIDARTQISKTAVQMSVSKYELMSVLENYKREIKN